MPTADELYACIRERFPVPDEIFANAHYIMCLRDAAAELSELCASEYAEILAAIHSEGLTSDEYELREVKAARFTVDIARARAELPLDIFADIVHVGQADAERLLTRRRLYELVLEAVGPERILAFQRVNRADLEARVPSAEAAAFLVRQERVVRTDVVQREGA